MRVIFFLVVAFTVAHPSIAQDFQEVTGRIIDKDSKAPLQGVVISTNSQGETISAETDEKGYFKLGRVTVGRASFSVQYLGYLPITLNNVLVSSGKQLVLDLEMEESVSELGEVQVSGVNKNEAQNDMTVVSARSFTVEEADKYPASRQDPARMAGNFAGVNSTSDARNDIVIRGNSPMGLLWRFQDVDIPNPSHFAIAGSTGGPLSIINTKYLYTSDFMTGAFPAEYGNANAGVFDLKMKNGNANTYEHTAQLGILGLELASEGPIKKERKSSYLATFRYSTFEALSFLNINLGTSAVPRYWDGAFKINLPTEKNGTFSVFAIGGMSNIDIVLSTIEERPKELFGDQNRDQYFRTRMGVFGVQHKHSLTNKLFLSTTFAQSAQSITSDHFLIYRYSNYKLKSLPHILDYGQEEYHTSLNLNLTYKVSPRLTLRSGIYNKHYVFSLYDRARFDSLQSMQNRAAFQNEQFQLIQPFVQAKYKITEKITVHGGVHGQWLTLNTASRSVEPRMGASWAMHSKHTLSYGLGMHSQMQPTYFYYISPDFEKNGAMNKNAGFSRSIMSVLTYDYTPAKDLRFKVEGYYQYLWDIPVYRYASGVSMVNQGATFSRFIPKQQMVNKGVGVNYGIEFTVEKFFSRNYYILFTNSLYQSLYQGSDNVWRNTDFNGNYISNLLAGHEWALDKKNKYHLVSGTKISYAGGRRYSPADVDSSNKYLDLMPKEDQINTLQFGDYFRLDLRLGLRANHANLNYEFMIDIINVTDRRNPLALSYSPDPADPAKDPYIVNYQLGRLPLFYFKVDF